MNVRRFPLVLCGRINRGVFSTPTVKGKSLGQGGKKFSSKFKIKGKFILGGGGYANASTCRGGAIGRRLWFCGEKVGSKTAWHKTESEHDTGHWDFKIIWLVSINP